MSSPASLLFGLRTRVHRKQYLIWGFALALVKFVVDTGIVYAFTKKTWSPLGYIVPSIILRNESLGNSSPDSRSASSGGSRRSTPS